MNYLLPHEEKGVVSVSKGMQLKTVVVIYSKTQIHSCTKQVTVLLYPRGTNSIQKRLSNAKGSMIESLNHSLSLFIQKQR